MPTELFKKLKALDPDIAQAYLKVTKDDPKAVIDADGVSQLFGQAVDDRKVTSKELDALILIFDRDPKLFTKDALDFATAVFGNRAFIEPLARANGTELNKDSDLDEILAALDLAGNNVDFWSPGTGLTYNVSAYQAVKQLVRDKEIHVVAVDDKGQVFDRGNVAALYDRELPVPVVLVFKKPTDKKVRQANLAHELTHAYQDFKDINSLTKYIETDAVLADGLVSLALGLKAPAGHPALPLIDLIKKGKQSDKKVWKAAYEKAADAVAKDPTYARQIKLKPNGDMKTGDEKKDQPKKLDAILKKLAAAKSGAAQGSGAQPGAAQGSGAQPGAAQGSGAQPGAAQGSGAQPGK
jgi:hypothetical protein